MIRNYHFNMKRIFNIGDKVWLVKTPYLMIHHQKQLENGPELYVIDDIYYIDSISYRLKSSEEVVTAVTTSG
jgi:hypothetical protein